MQTVVEKNVLRPESYIVEIDGKIGSAYGIFVEALKAGLELKQKFPHSRIQGPRSRSWPHRALIDD
jgi:hypothetical protein